jgi:peptidoglycan/LPS O-acetylase OafA/YrhL
MKINSIYFIRAVSIIMIIMFHFFIEASVKGLEIKDYYILSKLGDFGVSFFIIISGGGIFFSAKSGFSAKEFYKKRIINILPSLWVAYSVVAIFLYISINQIAIGWNPILILLSAIGMDGFLLSKTNTYYIVGEWFLGFIILIYLIFPVLLPALLKSKYCTLLACSLISIITFKYSNIIFEHFPIWNKSPMWNPTVRLPEFIFGVIFFDAISRTKKSHIYFLPIAVITIVIYSIGEIRYANDIKNIPLYIAWFVATVSSYELIFHGEFFKKAFIWLSSYSFMAFLFHHQIIMALSRNGNINSLTESSLYFGFIVTIVLSFSCAVLFTPISMKMKNSIQKLMIEKTNSISG